MMKRSAVFLIFEELLPKFLEPKKIWFLYYTALVLGSYFKIPGKFLGCM